MRETAISHYAGVDGCPGGWICAVGNEYDLQFVTISHISELFQCFNGINTVLIDIPIGLTADGNIRDIEQLARSELKPKRHASVFTPPVRAVLHSDNYVEACRLNQAETGKKISKQAWNILPKIREVDEFLTSNNDLRDIVREAHPEICFKYLNMQSVPRYSKHHVRGLGLFERRNILKKCIENYASIWDKDFPVETALNISSHDQLDATCLFITACLGAKLGFERLDASPKKDTYGLEMNMYFFDSGATK